MAGYHEEVNGETCSSKEIKVTGFAVMIEDVIEEKFNLLFSTNRK